MRYSLAAGHNASYESSKSVVSVHVRVVYKNKTNRRRKIRNRNGITVEQQWGGTSSQSWYITRFLAIKIEKWVKAYTLTLSSSRFSSLGWRQKKIWCWKKMEIQGKGRGRATLWEIGNMSTIWNIILIALTVLISLISKTVGKSQKNSGKTATLRWWDYNCCNQAGIGESH